MFLSRSYPRLAPLHSFFFLLSVSFHLQPHPVDPRPAPPRVPLPLCAVPLWFPVLSCLPASLLSPLLCSFASLPHSFFPTAFPLYPSPFHISFASLSHTLTSILSRSLHPSFHTCFASPSLTLPPFPLPVPPSFPWRLCTPCFLSVSCTSLPCSSPRPALSRCTTFNLPRYPANALLYLD